MAQMIKITPDAQLATPEAVLFRIELIKRESNGVISPAINRRIAALNLRISGTQASLTPVVNPAMLISKGEEEWGDRKCY